MTGNHPHAHAVTQLEALLQQGVAHHQAGQTGEAENCYWRVLEIDPGNPSALHLLGLIEHWRGNLERAESLIRAALQRDVRYAEAHNNLGNLLRDRGRPEEALGCHLAALNIRPDDEETCFSLGLTYQALGRGAEAREAYHRAVTLRPDYAAAWVNLGNVLEREGRAQEALNCFTRALEIQPASAETHYNLARLLQQDGQNEEAERYYALALQFDPRLAAAWYNLGILKRNREQLDAAVDCFRRALMVNPDYVDALNNLAGALKNRGDCVAALACYQQALALQPGDAEIFSNLLLALNYVSTPDPADMFASHREFAARFEAGLMSGWQQHDNLPEPQRRLRIAYLSPDFRRHPVANFIEPVLRCHDRSAFEIWCLYNHTVVDGETAHLRELADQWQAVAEVPDDVLAARIRAANIDILVDLAGHTAGNRLGVFARKPAPVQVTWLGYLNTTGLAAMDWRITDGQADPEGRSEAYYSERLIRLPHSQWCYHPFAGMPAPGPLPALHNGRLTFGSFNNVAKVSDETLSLWGQVLLAVTSSRLLLVGVPEGAARQRIASVLEKQGVASDRLDFRGKLSLTDYWATFAEADIALDCFPYNGGTTTCDALWAGLPVVSLSGECAATRGGKSLLTALGRAEWVADRAEDFVDITRTLAADLAALAKTRAELRQMMQTSPLMDEGTFTLALERAYREMWRAWCQQGDGT